MQSTLQFWVMPLSIFQGNISDFPDSLDIGMCSHEKQNHWSVCYLGDMDVCILNVMNVRWALKQHCKSTKMYWQVRQTLLWSRFDTFWTFRTSGLQMDVETTSTFSNNFKNVKVFKKYIRSAVSFFKFVYILCAKSF